MEPLQWAGKSIKPSRRGCCLEMENPPPPQADIPLLYGFYHQEDFSDTGSPYFMIAAETDISISKQAAHEAPPYVISLK